MDALTAIAELMLGEHQAANVVIRGVSVPCRRCGQANVSLGVIHAAESTASETVLDASSGRPRDYALDLLKENGVRSGIDCVGCGIPVDGTTAAARVGEALESEAVNDLQVLLQSSEPMSGFMALYADRDGVYDDYMQLLQDHRDGKI